MNPIRNVAIRNLTIVSRDPSAIAAPPIMADRVRPMRHEAIVVEQTHIVCDDPAMLSDASISTVSDRD